MQYQQPLFVLPQVSIGIVGDPGNAWTLRIIHTKTGMSVDVLPAKLERWAMAQLREALKTEKVV